MDYMRLLRADGQVSTEPGSPIRFTAATPGKKRDGLDTATLPWRVDRYQTNPVVTWVHDLMGQRLPIGRGSVTVKQTEHGEQIDAEVIFDVADPFAAEVDRKYRAGFLHASSVSWDDVDEDGVPVRRSGKKAVAHDLLEIAAVPVGGDPDALAIRQSTALRALLSDLEAIGGTDTPAQDETATGAHVEASDERPYPNEHACRLRDPGDFEPMSLKRSERDEGGKKYSVTMGKLKGETEMTEQSYRYPKDTWDEAEAKAHCTAHKGKEFSPATGEAFGGAKGCGCSDDEGAMPEARNADDDMREAAASAMLAAFDRESSDDERRTRYNWACVMYRWLKIAPPDWIEGAELRALDDTNWRAIVSGELDVIGARVGKELSSRNMADIQKGLEQIVSGAGAISAVIDRATGKQEFPPKKEEGERVTDREWVDAVTAQLEGLLARRAEG